MRNNICQEQFQSVKKYFVVLVTLSFSCNDHDFVAFTITGITPILIVFSSVVPEQESCVPPVFNGYFPLPIAIRHPSIQPPWAAMETTRIPVKHKYLSTSRQSSINKPANIIFPRFEYLAENDPCPLRHLGLRLPICVVPELVLLG